MLRLHSSTSSQQTSQRQESVQEEEGLLRTFINGVTSLFSYVFGGLDGTSSMSTPHHKIPGTFVGSESSLDKDDASFRGRSPSVPVPRKELPRRSSADTFTTLSSLDGSCSSCWTSSRSPSPRARSPDLIVRAPLPEFIHQQSPHRPMYTPPLLGMALPGGASARPPTISEDVDQLFQLLDLDGSFLPFPELKQIVGAGVLEKAEEFGEDSKLWAMLVAVAYLKENLQDEPDLLDALLDKAGDFIKEAQVQGRGRLPLQFEAMVRQASEILRLAQEGKL